MAENLTTSHAKKRFLNHFSRHGRFYDAAAYAGRTAHAVYDWLNDKKPVYDLKFTLAFEDAKKQFIEKLEKEADRRATEGVRKPLFYKGELIRDDKGNPVVMKEYSDTLLIVRLKALDPARYRENQSIDLTSKGKEIKPAPVFQIVDQETKDLLTRISDGERTVEADPNIQTERPGVPQP